MQGNAQDIPSPSKNTGDDLSWVQSLYEPGLKLENDSILVSDEFRLLLSNQDYYDKAYPSSYQWPDCIQLMKNGEYKLTFWYMLNLYPQNEKNQELVLRSILAYSKIFDMEKALNSVLYTYPMADPRISKMENGIPEVIRPDLFEEFRNTVIKLTYAVNKYQETQKE